MVTPDLLRSVFEALGVHRSGSGKLYARCRLCQGPQVGIDEYHLSVRPGVTYPLFLKCYKCSPTFTERRQHQYLFCENLRRSGVDPKPFLKPLTEQQVERLWAEVGTVGERVRTTELPCDPDLLHAVYSDLLDRLDLTDKHAKWLTKVGLEADLAYGLGYRSTPEDSGPVARDLFEKWGFRLSVVPGFSNVFTGQSISLLSRPQAVFTPCRDVQGRVLCLKMRMLDGGKGRHRLLAGGNSKPVVLCHVPLGVGSKQWEELWVTEGERKADVHFQRTGRPTVGIPGTGTHYLITSVLPYVVRPSATVCIALDRDGQPQTSQAILKLGQTLRGGYSVRTAEWDGGKGVDDALLRGAEIRTVEWKGEEAVNKPIVSSNNTLHIDSRPSTPLKDSEIVPYIRTHGPVLRSQLPLRHRNQEVLISKWVLEGKLRIREKTKLGQVLEAVDG